MLQRTVSYSSLVRVLGACFLVYGLAVLVLALTAQINMGGSVTYSGPIIFFDNPLRWRLVIFLFLGGFFPGAPIVPVPGLILFPFGPLTPGPLFWVGLGILCVSLTSRRVPVAYGGLQVALWMMSASVWTPILSLHHSTYYDVGELGLLFWVTLALSLILALLYKPVTHSLTRLVSPPM